MTAEEIIAYIGGAEKKTPVKVYVNERSPIDYGAAKVFGEGRSKVIFGDWRDLAPILSANAERIADIEIENDRRNSAIPLLDLKSISARIEPGAIIREQVTIGETAVIMMGAILNIGAVVGPGTMIDMGAVLGGRATVGARCHVGAGAVLAGVIECRSSRLPRPGDQDEGRGHHPENRPAGHPPQPITSALSTANKANKRRRQSRRRFRVLYPCRSHSGSIRFRTPEIMPMAANMVTMELPPELKKGSVRPITGMTNRHMPMFSIV